MTVNVSEALRDFIHNLMTDRQFAGNYAEDPQGMLAAQGVTDHDLSGVDVNAAVRDVCADPSVPAEARTAVQNSGPPPSSGASHSVDSVVQHLNHITYATYEGDDYITNLIDQSVDNSVDVSGPVFGDLDVVTGEKGQIIDGPNFGNANTGDGAVQAGRDAEGVNTGINTGINAGGDVEDAVVGDGNQTAQVDGSADGSVFNFGDGDVTNLGNADVEDSAVSFGEGDATNLSDVTVDDGSAIAVGGSASGSNVEDNDTTVVTTVEDNDTTVNDNDTTIEDNDTTVTSVQDNDTVIADNDVAVAGDDQLAVQ
ncbi:hypothetical protein [Actinophytocola sp. KF-1]